MTGSIVSPGKTPGAGRRWIAVGFALLVGLLGVWFAASVLRGDGGPMASVADMVEEPVRAKGPDGDRVYLMTSQWRTWRGPSRRPARGGLLVDVWAFAADTGKPVWRRRVVDDRGGVNMGRKILGAQAGVLWLLDGRQLVGLKLADGTPAFDVAAIEAANPALKGLMPTEDRYYRFDGTGLTFTAADGRLWRLTGDGAATTPGTEPSDSYVARAKVNENPAPGVFVPANTAGGNGTSAFYGRGMDIGSRWLGLLHEREVDLFRRGRIGGVDPERNPRMRLWSARIVQEQTFFGPRPKFVDFAALPESPEFLQPALLTPNDIHDTPIVSLKPDSVFVLHRDRLGADGKLRLSKVAGPAGKVLWTADLPVETLEAVLPGERSIVLIGRRGEAPLLKRPNDTSLDSVHQLVSVDIATGRMGVYGFRVKPGKAGEIPESSTKTP
jgi:hypothetical protein